MHVVLVHVEFQQKFNNAHPLIWRILPKTGGTVIRSNNGRACVNMDNQMNKNRDIATWQSAMAQLQEKQQLQSFWYSSILKSNKEQPFSLSHRSK